LIEKKLTMVILGEADLNAETAYKIIYENEQIQVSDLVVYNAEENFQFLKRFSADKIIYGINTGFGPMAQYRIPDSDQIALQYNLIRSHASGMGNPINEIFCRAMLLDRLCTFTQCKSGVHPELLLLLAGMLNAGLSPVIYEHGGVGASGDLVQLAHLSLAVIGEGELMKEGIIYPAAEALHKAGLTPFNIRIREGLAMMNGTSCMTGIGLVNLYESMKILSLNILISGTINEIFEAFDDHISQELNETKKHYGQRYIASVLRAILKNSKLLQKRDEHLYNETDEVHFKQKVQEYYSLRCMPQILGPVADTIYSAMHIVLDELNSVSDNPIIDNGTGNIFHGGNFHGDYIALEMDKVRLAVIKMSMLAERQLNYLLNNHLNKKLPAFINQGIPGLNFGIQGIQYTATSTVAENQALGTSLYIHSIPSNNDNQDIVSMGSNAALATARTIENTFQVLSIHCLALAEAIDYLGMKDRISQHPRVLYDGIRANAGSIESDQAKFKELAAINTYLKSIRPDLILSYDRSY
jgi:histidine ammonia-lyase